MPDPELEYELGPNAPARAPARALRDRVQVLLADWTSSSDLLTQRLAEELVRELVFSDGGLPVGFDESLAAIAHAQGWRAPIARLLHALRGAPEVAAIDGQAGSPAEILLQELGNWLADQSGRGPWSGRPLAPGARRPDPAKVLPNLRSDLPREGVLLLGGGLSDPLLRVTSEWARTFTVLLSPGGLTRVGEEAAEALLACGLSLRYLPEAALLEQVAAADMVWLGTEALGAHGFLAPIGTTRLLEECERHEVRALLIATSGQWMPAGEIMLPDERLLPPLLWAGAPPRIELRAQPFEVVPYSPSLAIASDCGRERPAEFALAALDVREPITPRRFADNHIS